MTLVGQIGTTKIKQSGYNPNLPESGGTVWTGTPSVYRHPPVAAQMFVSSTNSEDGDGAKTGALLLEVHGLNSAWAIHSEFKILNGVNVVQTSEYFNRVYLLHVHSAGLAGKNIGEICCGAGSVSNGIPNSMYSHIGSGDNKGLAGFFTVPASCTSFLNAVHYTVGQDKDIECSLFYRKFGSVFQLEDRVKVYRNTVERDWYNDPFELPPKTDIEIRGKKDTAGGTIAMTAGFDLVVKPRY